ncbi:TolC family protein [Spongiibacter marinus]|uniref:TolC family protein n=1 Tax=Spongiibacter marinus TaxID=354246 RepID=UPI000A0449C9|nr:TolC family protein [Spongiibacter marinus]
MNIMYLPCRRWLALVLCLAASAAQAQLTLQEAITRALDENPQLQVFPLRQQAAEAQRESANLRPGYTLGIAAENLAGSGEFSGTDKAEYALSIGSVIELGGKRSARTALADTRYAQIALEREIAALDLIAAVTQGFATVLSLQQQIEVEERALQLANESLSVASRLARNGAAPDADRLRAKAQQAQVELNLAALQAKYDVEKLALATLWGAGEAQFEDVSGDLFANPAPDDFPILWRRVESSPGIAIMASEQRMAEAELALVRSQSSANVGWRLGVRRDQFSGDSGLIASMDIPLFSGGRNRGEEKAARAQLESQAYRQEDARLALRRGLYRAWKTYQQRQLATRSLQADVIPALESAQAHTRRAYEQGRYRYTDWLAAQNELLDAQRRLISEATSALYHQALIEQLTATPLSEESRHDQ